MFEDKIILVQYRFMTTLWRKVLRKLFMFNSLIVDTWRCYDIFIYAPVSTEELLWYWPRVNGEK